MCLLHANECHHTSISLWKGNLYWLLLSNWCYRPLLKVYWLCPVVTLLEVSNRKICEKYYDAENKENLQKTNDFIRKMGNFVRKKNFRLSFLHLNIPPDLHFCVDFLFNSLDLNSTHAPGEPLEPVLPPLRDCSKKAVLLSLLVYFFKK